MAEILEFRAKRGRSRVYNAAGPDHFEVPLVELGPGGSLAGATEPEMQAAALRANPMRRVATWGCQVCDCVWKAPTGGACPKCFAPGPPELLHEHINMAQRLK